MRGFALFRGLGKGKILILICAVLFLVLPTVVTLKLCSRMDKVNEETHNIVSSSVREDSFEESTTGAEIVASINQDEIVDDSYGYGFDEEDKLDEETVRFPLATSADPSADAGVATAADAEEDVEAEKDSESEEISKSSEETEDSSLEDSDILKDSDINEASESDAQEETTDWSSVPKNGKTVYLTFDDGPSEYTEELLDILDKYNVKATFFVVAADRKYTKQLKMIADRGHTIGLHSYSHVYSELYADIDSYKADVEGVHDWVLDATGIDSHYYRFPGGSSNTVSSVSMDECIEYLNEEGYTYFDWNSMSGDAESLSYSPEQLTDNVLYYVRANEGNSTVLLHDLDDHYHTVESLPGLIEALLSEGYTLSPIDDSTYPVHHYSISD